MELLRQFEADKEHLYKARDEKEARQAEVDTYQDKVMQLRERLNKIESEHQQANENLYEKDKELTKLDAEVRQIDDELQRRNLEMQRLQLHKNQLESDNGQRVRLSKKLKNQKLGVDEEIMRRTNDN